MCLWSASALFNCDGTVQRSKHLCKLIPLIDPATGRDRAGDEIFNNHDLPRISSPHSSKLLGCKHSETQRPEVMEAVYRHVCHRDQHRYKSNCKDVKGDTAAKDQRQYRTQDLGEDRKKAKKESWSPVIKEFPSSHFPTAYIISSSCTSPCPTSTTTKVRTRGDSSSSNNVGTSQEKASLKNGILFRWCDGRLSTIQDVFALNRDHDQSRPPQPEHRHQQHGSKDSSTYRTDAGGTVESTIDDVHNDNNTNNNNSENENQTESDDLTTVPAGVPVPDRAAAIGTGWHSVDLLFLRTEDRNKLLGVGMLEYWVGVWSGLLEKGVERMGEGVS